MDCFKLRVPTIADWEAVWNCIPASQRIILHWSTAFPKNKYGKPGTPNYRTFHLSDPDIKSPDLHCCAGFREVDGQYAVAPSDYKLQFRPVLEAEGDISCLKDGTVIQMGNLRLGDQIIPVPDDEERPFLFPGSNQSGVPTLSYFPYETEGFEPISWIKCGNILMADRSLVDGISLDQLKDMHLIEGVSKDTPFQAVAANYFYDLSMNQPFSPQRQMGDIMADLHRELESNDVVNIPDRNILFAISNRIYQSWNNDESIDLYRAVLAVSFMLTRGLENFYYYNRDEEHCIADFSPGVLRNVLSTCLQDEFNILLDDTMDRVIKRTVEDKDGHPTALGRVLNRLETVERSLMKEFDSLQTMVQSADERAAASPAHKTKISEPSR